MPCGRNVALRRWDKGKEWCFCRCFEQYKKTPSILYLLGRPTAALRRRAPEENSAFERIAFEWAAAALPPLPIQGGDSASVQFIQMRCIQNAQV